jgi:type IV pilus assembly protein PilW
MKTRLQKGMSLVELLVWMAVSLLVITVIGVIYMNTKQITRVNDTVSRLQENGRFVIHLLDRDLRMVGYRGCNGGAVTPANVLNSTAYPYNFDVAIAGFYGNSGSWSPALDSSISSLTPAPTSNTDVVTIRHIDGPGVALTAAMGSTTADLQVSPASPLATGDVLLVADCANAAIFNATSFNSGSGVIGHEVAAGVPGNTTKNLGYAFSTDASVYRLVTRTYYVAPSARKPGTNALWANSVPAYDLQPQPEEMVEGVDGMVVFYGEDTDGDRAANRYVTANAVGTWNNVVSARPQVLLATVLDKMTTKAQPYTFNGVTTTPTDLRMRTVLTSVVTVRNRVP